MDAEYWVEQKIEILKQVKMPLLSMDIAALPDQHEKNLEAK